MPPKIPEPKFKTQAEWHAYLDSLTYPQLKKVSASLNKVLRVDYRLDTKKTQADLLADVKKLYSVNNVEKLILAVRGIDKDELPKPKPPAPTKKEKQAGQVAEFMGGMKDMSEQVKKTADVKPKSKVEEKKMSKGEEEENILVDNWVSSNSGLFDIYLYRDVPGIKPEVFERFVNSKKDFSAEYLIDKFPLKIIKKVYERYGLKGLLKGILNFSKNLKDNEKDKIYLGSHKMPWVKLNDEFQKWYKDNNLSSKTSFDDLMKLLK